MLPMPAKSRITRELGILSKDPPPGIACYPAPAIPSPSSTSSKSSSSPSPPTPTSCESLTHLHATITGPPSSPFSKGIFLVSIRIPPRYPFEPPRARFRTPLHHPNIDSAGRICLDTLKSPPAGCWSPAVSLPSLLLTLRTLLGEPNAEDGLVPEITKQFGRDYEGWWREAEEMTEREATEEKLRRLEDGGLPLSEPVASGGVVGSEDHNEAAASNGATMGAKRPLEAKDDEDNQVKRDEDRAIKQRTE